jgi:hypothetical protein
MAHSTIDEIDGEYSLTFYCGDLPADPAISAAGHEPNGYFWEGVAALLGGDLVESLELDSEGSMFCALGEADDLVALQAILEPALSSPDAVLAVIERAEAEGFEFDD